MSQWTIEEVVFEFFLETLTQYLDLFNWVPINLKFQAGKTFGMEVSFRNRLPLIKHNKTKKNSHEILTGDSKQIAFIPIRMLISWDLISSVLKVKLKNKFIGHKPVFLPINFFLKAYKNIMRKYMEKISNIST